MAELIIANFAVGIIMLMVGLIIRSGKANFLIAGYNTMSREERDAYDMDAVSKFIGRMLLISSVILFVGGILISLDFYPTIVSITSFVVFMMLMISIAVYLNTGNRFKRK